MELFPIRSFRPIENSEENTDQDRTVLRLCEGLIAIPTGAVSSGPNWKAVWGLTTLATSIASALSAASSSKAHFVTVTRGNHVFVVVWSKLLTKPLGCFYVTTGVPADADFDSTSGVSLTATNNSVFRDKDGSAPWFASQIGNRVYFGNGIDDNVQWKDGALVALGPSSPPASLYDNSRVKIPACTSFAMGGNKSIFAAGNTSSPKRVWVTHPPTAENPFNEGVYSLDTSFIDLTYSEATRITALSAYQNYVTAHTDRKPVNLYDVDGATDGFKCVQAPGAANASAPSPACVRDTNGLASYYLGADGEVYEDQAVRVGPYDKRPAREQDIATRRGAGAWNREMTKPVASGKALTAYDRKTGLFWMFAEMATFSGRLGLWTYNEKNRSVCGPFRSPDALAAASVAATADSGAIVAVFTSAGSLLYANLADVGETEEFLQEDAAAALGAAYAEETSAPTPTVGLSYVGMTSDRATIAEVMSGGTRATLASVWSPITSGGSQTLAKFYNNAYLARLETGYLDFGDDDLRKNYLQALITWQRHSRAYVGIYAETEDGRRGGAWGGSVFSKESSVVPLNLVGRRIRLRIVAVCFNGSRSLIRGLAIGWSPAGRA